jgi:hypothetical protein
VATVSRPRIGVEPTFFYFCRRAMADYLVYPEALGPVNEQLRGPDEAWLQWVKATLANLPAPPNPRASR